MSDTPPRPNITISLPSLARWAWAGMAGGLLLLIGPFLPWLKVSAPLIGTISRSGVDSGFTSDGWFFVCISVTVVVMVVRLVREPQRRRSRVLVGIGVVACALTAFEIHQVAGRVSAASSSDTLVIASYGLGLWVLCAGSFLALVSGLWSLAN